jgi:hypothetical protein
LKFPDDIKKLIMRKFQRHHKEWLKNPELLLEIKLDIPSEQIVLRQQEDVQAWITAWQNWNSNVLKTGTYGILFWTERHWRIPGTQTVPEKLILNNHIEAVSWIDKTDEWSLAVRRYKAMVQIWPALINVLARHYNFLAFSREMDYSCLPELLKWLSINRDSGLYPRQIPVAGIHSKWLENNKKLVCELSVIIKNSAAEQQEKFLSKEESSIDFYKVCGLKPLPQLMRMRILDPHLRSITGGLYDISIPIEEAANLANKPAKVFIVENLQTGLAFQDLPGSVVIMGLGYGVDILEKIPWLNYSQCIYWGDIDTHGFAILNQARKYLPALESILMDEATLLNHRQLCVEERKQHPSSELPLLTNGEQKTYTSLKGNVWGQALRLEQERVCWDTAWNVIQTAAAVN